MNGNGDAPTPAASGHVAGLWPATWRVLVLDDDPTGAQTLTGVRVFLDWTTAELTEALKDRPSLHLLTNSRALAAEKARTCVASAASAARSAWPEAAIVLRGDSTLRGHLLEEYLAVAESAQEANHPPLMLTPALPSAGRVTVGGIQYLERDGRRIPVHLTEFATDGQFAYRSSRLLEWAEQRSAGFFNAARGIEVRLETLRKQGPSAVAEALEHACRLRPPVVLVTDSETSDDLDIVADGYRRAVTAGNQVVLRCGPALAGALEGTAATRLVTMPSAYRVLLVAGSYVQQSARQLAQVRERYPDAVREVDADTLAFGTAADLTAISNELSQRLDQPGLAVLTTPATRQPHMSGLDAGLRVAHGLARIVSGIDRPGMLAILKGGVTSAITLRYGLGAQQAAVTGPVLPGVALWQITQPTPGAALVVPGNVGDEQLLVRLIEMSWQRT